MSLSYNYYPILFIITLPYSSLITSLNPLLPRLALSWIADSMGLGTRRDITTWEESSTKSYSYLLSGKSIGAVLPVLATAYPQHDNYNISASYDGKNILFPSTIPS